MREIPMYASPYQKKKETEDLIAQVNELRRVLSLCWTLLPDGKYGNACIEVKKCMTKYNCWPGEM